MPSPSDPYVYRLTLHNRTLRPLVVAEKNLMRGLWFRGEIDHEAPATVPAGALVEALGIRASSTRNRGYACRCVWRGETDDPAEQSAFAFSIDVPLLGMNKAGLDVSGRFKVTGWTGVPTFGHYFSQTLVVAYAV